MTVAITGLEMQTAVGLSRAESAANIRAGVAGFSQHAWYTPLNSRVSELASEEELVTVAGLPGLEDRYDDLGRLQVMVEDVVQGAIVAAGIARSELPMLAVWFALPEADIASTEALAELVKTTVTSLGLSGAGSRGGIATGNTGVFALCKRAEEALAQGRFRRILVIAVDSFLLRERLAHYDALWRIKSRRNPHGFIPGEAAGALVLEDAAQAASAGRVILAQIKAVALDQEPDTIGGEAQSSGVGLTRAARQVLAAQSEACAWIYSDLNGEPYKAAEWGLVQIRLAGLLAPQVRLHHPADCIGEVGATSALVHLGCVVESLRKAYAGGSTSALLLAGNHDDGRAAMLVSA